MILRQGSAATPECRQRCPDKSLKRVLLLWVRAWSVMFQINSSAGRASQPEILLEVASIAPRTDVRACMYIYIRMRTAQLGSRLVIAPA